MKASELTKLFQTWTLHQVRRQPRFLNDASSQLAAPGSILFNVGSISIATLLLTLGISVLIPGFVPARRSPPSVQLRFYADDVVVFVSKLSSKSDAASQSFDGLFKDQWGRATWHAVTVATLAFFPTFR